MTKVTALAWHKQSRKAELEDMSLQTSAKCGQERMQMLCAAAVHSTHMRRWQEKLCRQWLRDAYARRPVTKMALNEGDIVGWDPPTGRVRQQGTRVLLHVSTCIQGQQAWSQFTPMPWASATDGGAEWCGRTLMKKTPVGQPSSSSTVAASANTAGFRKEWHCHGPAVSMSDIVSDWNTGLETDRRTLRSCCSTAKRPETVFVTCDFIKTSSSI